MGRSGQIGADLKTAGVCSTRGNKMAARRGRGDEWADLDRLEQI